MQIDSRFLRRAVLVVLLLQMTGALLGSAVPAVAAGDPDGSGGGRMILPADDPPREDWLSPPEKPAGNALAGATEPSVVPRGVTAQRANPRWLLAMVEFLRIRLRHP